MNKYSPVLILFIALLLLPIRSQDRDIGDKFLTDAAIFADDGVSYFTYPFRMSGSEWLYTAGIAGGSYLIMHTDTYFKNKIGRGTTQTLNDDF